MQNTLSHKLKIGGHLYQADWHPKLLELTIVGYKVMLYKEPHSNGIVWRLSLRLRMLIQLFWPSYTWYYLVLLSWYWYLAIHLFTRTMLCQTWYSWPDWKLGTSSKGITHYG